MSTTMRQAINRGLGDAMDVDPDVFILGEDVSAAGGPFKVTQGLRDRFGTRRVLDTPISEQAIVGCAIGAAVQGLRPIAEIMFADFSAVCYDQIVNQMPKLRYMSAGQTAVPMVIRMANGGGSAFAAQHSQCAENWFLNVPGLKVVVPGTPADAYGLIRAAIQDPDPVLYFEHKGLYNLKGDLGETPEPVEIGRAAIVRPGEHVTIVATQAMRIVAEEAAERLSIEGVSAEVIDPRTLVPLDTETVGASVDRTNHLIVVEESSPGGCWGSTLITQIVQERFESLDAAPILLAADPTPVPYAQVLEAAALPSADKLVDLVKSVLGEAA